MRYLNPIRLHYKIKKTKMSVTFKSYKALSEKHNYIS